MVYHIVVNPVSGVGAAPKFVETHVVPLLAAVGEAYKVYTTSGVNDAGRTGQDIQAGHDGTPKVIIAAGDGTAHELMEGIFKGEVVGKWELAVLPMGTANALHSTLFPPGGAPIIASPDVERHLPKDAETRHALSSLTLALSGTVPKRLPITLSRLLGPSSSPSPPIPSHIVLSTSLHATILADSEDLRESVPGLERFKQAAAMNIGVSFPARVDLLPGNDGVKQYDPYLRDWAEPFTGDVVDGRVRLQGPFSYFLSATKTDRLEPSFVIVPTLASPGNGTMDIVILRPRRDSKVAAAISAGGDGSDEQAKRSMEALHAAYEKGRHVNLVYGPDGDAIDAEASDSERRDVVVETFRCRGFTWTPEDPSHTKSHIVCADGSLYTIPTGGSVEATVLDEGAGGFWVWG